MYIELVWMAFASTAAATLGPLPLPEPTELFAPDNGLLDLPPKPYVYDLLLSIGVCNC
jgi:glucan 1,3-beta-glucosidase